jgi:hypothetical protein
MSLWGRNDQSVTANSVTTTESTNGAPIGTGSLVKWDKKNRTNAANAHFGNTSVGTRANTDVAMFGNATPSQFINGLAVGVFGVSATEMANSGNSSSHDHPAHAGWVVRRAGTGPVITATISASNAGLNVANGETITVSNSLVVVNATLTITTNATGNIVSLAVSNGGYGFTNSTGLVYTFNRELHLANVQITGGSLGPSYTNGSLLTVSNTAGVQTPAVLSLTTNATGYVDNTSFTNVNIGLFKTTQTNTGVTFAISNAGTGNTTATSFNARLIPSTLGNVASVSFGGRAGRVWTETLVAMGSLGAQTGSYGTPVLVTDANTAATGNDDPFYPGV